MARMKTFLIYFLCLVGFILFSYIIENALLENMYVTMAGNVADSSNGIEINDVQGKASNGDGYMSFKIKDTSGNDNPKYLKVDLYSKSNNLVATKYLTIDNLDENKEKIYQLKIKGQEIRKYDISIIDELPDMSNIISVFGYDIDLSDVFGLDLSNASIFGKKLTDIFNKDKAVNTAKGAWNWTASFLKSIPWWGYAIGGGIILWYMPIRFLFGLFPF